MSSDNSSRRRKPPDLRRAPIGDTVATYIRSLIVTGEIRMGEFVRLDRIAQELRVSVAPVREALLTLRSEGLVQLEPNRGFVVARFDAHDVRDLFRLRSLIGAEIAERATARVRAPELAALRKQSDRWERDVATRDFTSISEDAREFQRMVHDIAAAPVLRRVYEQLMQGTMYSAFVMDGITAVDPSPDSEPSSLLRVIVDTVRQYECDLLDAFAAGDARAAAAAAATYDERIGELVATNLAHRRSLDIADDG